MKDSKVFQYIDWEGKPREHYLKPEDTVTESRCPIDNTPLIETIIQADHFSKKDVYSCPFCGNDYHSLEPERLQHSRQIILKDLAERLAEVEQEQKYISKLIRLAQSSPKRTPNSQDKKCTDHTLDYIYDGKGPTLPPIQSLPKRTETVQDITPVQNSPEV